MNPVVILILERNLKLITQMILRAMHSERNPYRTKLLKEEVDILKEKINFLEVDNNALKAENDTQMKNERLYNYENTSRNKEHFKKATGLDHESFLNLFEFVDPGEDCKNMKFYDSSKRLSEAQFLYRQPQWIY